MRTTPEGPGRLPPSSLQGITPAKLNQLADELGKIEDPTVRLVAGVELMTAILESSEQLEVACWTVRGAIGLRARPEMDDAAAPT